MLERGGGVVVVLCTGTSSGESWHTSTWTLITLADLVVSVFAFTEALLLLPP